MQEPALLNTVETTASNEQILSAVNAKTFSNTSSKDVYTQQLPKEFWANENLHIVLGCDSGLLIKHLIATGIPHNAAYLFIEHKAIIDTIKALTPELKDYG